MCPFDDMTDAVATPLDGLIESLSECLDAGSARRVVEFHVDSKIQAGIDLLAEKANEGLWSAEERSPYEGPSARRVRGIASSESAQATGVRLRIGCRRACAVMCGAAPAEFANIGCFPRKGTGCLITSDTSWPDNTAAATIMKTGPRLSSL
jgi:hypothetical protein